MILAAITTCRRKPAMVERAVKSVIAQTFTDWDLVVVDDSPADYEFREGVRRMVESYAENDSRIKYVAHDKNYGANHARNTALNIALDTHKDFIAYLDDDDEWLPEKLEKQFAKFQECGEDVAVINCGYIYFNESLAEKRVRLPQKIHNDLSIFTLGAMCCSTSFPLIRTRCLGAVGGFDYVMNACQELEIMFIRMMKIYKLDFVYEPLCIYHVHGEQRINTNRQKYIIAYEYILAKNRDYLRNHVDEYRLKLADLALFYAYFGEHKKSFNVWRKMVKLKPLRIIRNLYVLVKICVKIKVPKFYFALKDIMYKLKGENYIGTNTRTSL